MSAPTMIERVCDVLETIAQEMPIEVGALGAATGLDYRTLRRYLAALVDAGFVVLDPIDRAVAGPRLRLIADELRGPECQ